MSVFKQVSPPQYDAIARVMLGWSGCSQKKGKGALFRGINLTNNCDCIYFNIDKTTHFSFKVFIIMAFLFVLRACNLLTANADFNTHYCGFYALINNHFSSYRKDKFTMRSPSIQMVSKCFESQNT